MMKRTGWYLVSYDIRAINRLMRVHRILMKNGIALQKSVFLISGNESELNVLLDTIALKMNLREDDLRAYPISHLENVWFHDQSLKNTSVTSKLAMLHGGQSMGWRKSRNPWWKKLWQVIRFG